MRYMMFIKHTEDFQPGDVPASLYEAMGTFIGEMTKSGNFVDGAGLQRTSAGFRVRLQKGKITVVDGPFTESKEIVVGYWVWEVGSLAEALEWARRCPSDPNDTTTSWLEIRPCVSMEDFVAEQQA